MAKCNFSAFLTANITASLTGFFLSGSLLTYTYTITQNIQNDPVLFYFNPAVLTCIPNAFNYFPVSISTEINPTNN